MDTSVSVAPSREYLGFLHYRNAADLFRVHSQALSSKAVVIRLPVNSVFGFANQISFFATACGSQIFRGFKIQRTAIAVLNSKCFKLSVCNIQFH